MYNGKVREFFIEEIPYHINKLKINCLNYWAYLKFKFLMKLIGGYSLTRHMATKLPLTEEDVAKIICYINKGGGERLIKWIEFENNSRGDVN